MLSDGDAIAAACAVHLGLPAPETVSTEDDVAVFARMLSDLADPALPPSTFTDLALAILFSLSKRFEPDLLVAIGAYRGVGARALTVGRLTALAEGAEASIHEVLCDVDPDCASQLEQHRDACIAVFGTKATARLERRYASRTSHTPSPAIVAELPKARRYTALIDLDSPETGKAGYAEAARYLIESQKSAGLLIFHDVCVPRFSSDIVSLEQTLTGMDVPYLELPIDACGLGVAYAA